jgi:uncharacterized protein YndB with AHSA1/START domain
VTKRSLEYDVHLDQPPAAVWQALTDPALLAPWWAAGDVRAQVGHTFTLDMGAWGAQACTVLDVEDARLLRYTFGEGVLDSTLTWRLEPEDGGTRLTLSHGDLDPDSPAGRQAIDGMGSGWPAVLERLPPVLGEE